MLQTRTGIWSRTRRRLGREFERVAKARGYARVNRPAEFRQLAEAQGYAKVEPASAFERLAESRGYARVQVDSPSRDADQSRVLLRLIRPSVPRDSAAQATAFTMLERVVANLGEESPKLLDFGSGGGGAVKTLRKYLPNMSYTGIDLSVDAAPDDPSLRFVAYDGVTMPFDDGSFDLCFTKQVLEHVMDPHCAAREISRVLRPGGKLVGSVSFLEPYHAFSTFNWSPYGLVSVFSQYGLRVDELRPGIDGGSMFFRALLGREHFRTSFGHTSTYNRRIENESKSDPIALRNARKLSVAGHICFIATKVDPPVE